MGSHPAVTLVMYTSVPWCRLPVLSAGPSVTFSAAECHCPLTVTNLCCLVTEAHGCQQLAEGCYSTAGAQTCDD